MSPLETIQAARALLATLRENATPGPWKSDEIGWVTSGAGSYDEGASLVCLPGEASPSGSADAALIVTLAHPAVLDAIDALLTGWDDEYIDVGSMGFLEALALATALLAAHPEGDKK